VISFFASGKYQLRAKGLKRILTVEDVGEDDFGNYICQTEDGRASLDHDFKKEERQHLLLKQIEDKSACEGEEITFETEVADESVNIHVVL